MLTVSGEKGIKIHLKFKVQTQASLRIYNVIFQLALKKKKRLMVTLVLRAFGLLLEDGFIFLFLLPPWPLELQWCLLCWFVYINIIQHFVTNILKCNSLSSWPQSFRFFPSAYHWFSAHLLHNMPNYQSPKGQKSTTLSHDHADILQTGRSCSIRGDERWERGQFCPWGFL